MTQTKAGTDTVPAITDEPDASNGGGLAVAEGHNGSLIADSDEWSELPDTFAGLDDGLPAPFMRPDRRGAGGFWVDDLTNQKFESLEVVLLTGRRTRAWWEADYDGSSNPPDCRSFDGLEPDPQSPKLQNTACVTCPHSQFVDGKASSCRERYDVLAYDPESKAVFMTAFSGAAIKPFRRYLSSFKAKIPKRPPYSVLTRITLVETKGDMGTFYVPEFSRVRELTPADVAPLLASQRSAIDAWLSWVDRSVVTGETVDVDADTTTAAPSQAYEEFPNDDEPADGEIVEDEVDVASEAQIKALVALANRAGVTPAGVLLHARKFAHEKGLGEFSKLEQISPTVVEALTTRYQAELGEEPF
jgi:hypothetical protein